jgi:transcriptional regulator with XRE-family HTH domain
MKASEWIDRVKVKNGWDSDYRVAKELGITRGGMSQIRTGESVTLREETAVKVAQFLQMNPAGIVLDQLVERSKTPEVRTTLAREVERLCILC